ncbi:MAG: hypothetical protein QOJ11_2602 [Frankiales bacterium]|jgi:hypothetical protein|nr:hypothetical protein [Frankiales bacterium]
MIVVGSPHPLSLGEGGSVMAASFADAADGCGPIVLRTSWPRALASAGFAGALPMAFPLVALVTRQPGHAPIDGLSQGTLAFFTAMTCLSLWAERSKSLRLGPGTLTLRTGLRVRRLAVADVAAVTLERYAGARMVTLWTRDGKAHRVGAAGRTRGLVRESFDRDWHTVGSWWLANGGDPRPHQVAVVPTFATSWADPAGFDWRPTHTSNATPPPTWATGQTGDLKPREQSIRDSWQRPGTGC